MILHCIHNASHTQQDLDAINTCVISSGNILSDASYFVYSNCDRSDWGISPIFYSVEPFTTISLSTWQLIFLLVVREYDIQCVLKNGAIVDLQPEDLYYIFEHSPMSFPHKLFSSSILNLPQCRLKLFSRAILVLPLPLQSTSRLSWHSFHFLSRMKLLVINCRVNQRGTLLLLFGLRREIGTMLLCLESLHGQVSSWSHHCLMMLTSPYPQTWHKCCIH